jgi:Subtilase family
VSARWLEFRNAAARAALRFPLFKTKVQMNFNGIFRRRASAVLACGVASFASPWASAQTTTPTALPTNKTWTWLAAENGALPAEPAGATVYYGAKDKWIAKSVKGQGACTNAFFGANPIPGTVKSCVKVGGRAPADTNWSLLATDQSNFTVNGSRVIRYGDGANWVLRTASGAGQCSAAFFGFDASRVTPKICQVALPMPHVAYPNLWNYQHIKLASAVAASNQTPPARIRIALIDTGKVDHPDIRWAPGGTELPASSPIDLYDRERDGKHGLHVAGIIGGIEYNKANLGANARVGACPQCEILSIKVNDLSDANTAKAIDFAVNAGAKVINMSFASRAVSPCTNPENRLLREAIARATASGVSLVAAAGDHGPGDTSRDPANPPSFDLTRREVSNVSPASCPGVISVGASDQSRLIAEGYSNFGAPGGEPNNGGSSLTLIAPGGGLSFIDGLYGTGVNCPAGTVLNRYGNEAKSSLGIFSTHSVDGSPTTHCYRYLAGTGIAAPHVTGTIGLMLSVQPGLSPSQVKKILVQSAQKDVLSNPTVSQFGRVAMCANGRCGAGLLDALAAVNLAKVTAPEIPTPGPNSGPCAYAPNPASCKLDAIAYKTMGTQDSTEEVVIAYGRLWRYNADGSLKEGAKELKNTGPYSGAEFGPFDPARAIHPCSRRPNGQTCTIDSLTILNHDQWGYVESISAYGYGFNFDANGRPWPAPGSSFPLTSIDRYGGGLVFGPANPGPCSFKPAGQDCKFDTRTFVDARDKAELGNDYIESITAYGHYFLYRSDGSYIGHNTLTSVARYAAGPCSYAPAGGICKFDSLDFKRVNNRLVEVITAYGRYWEFDGQAMLPTGNGRLLKDVARFK